MSKSHKESTEDDSHHRSLHPKMDHAAINTTKDFVAATTADASKKAFWEEISECQQEESN